VEIRLRVEQRLQLAENGLLLLRAEEGGHVLAVDETLLLLCDLVLFLPLILPLLSRLSTAVMSETPASMPKSAASPACPVDALLQTRM
jgi:hypothetical protein